jgi:hypothetical protein
MISATVVFLPKFIEIKIIPLVPDPGCQEIPGDQLTPDCAVRPRQLGARTSDRAEADTAERHGDDIHGDEGSSADLGSILQN